MDMEYKLHSLQVSPFEFFGICKSGIRNMSGMMHKNAHLHNMLSPVFAK